MSSSYALRPTASSPSVAAGVRLTRRGRLVVFAAALLLALSALWLLSGVSSASDRPEATEVVLVGTGDTLWGIASEIASERADSDGVVSMMAHIKDLNDLDSAALRAGQRLRVPA